MSACKCAPTKHPLIPIRMLTRFGNIGEPRCLIDQSGEADHMRGRDHVRQFSVRCFRPVLRGPELKRSVDGTILGLASKRSASSRPDLRTAWNLRRYDSPPSSDGAPCHCHQPTECDRHPPLKALVSERNRSFSIACKKFRSPAPGTYCGPLQ
jgi:hypothetical protein